MLFRPRALGPVVAVALGTLFLASLFVTRSARLNYAQIPHAAGERPDPALPKTDRLMTSESDDVHVEVVAGRETVPKRATVVYPDGERVAVRLRTPTAPMDIPGPSLAPAYATYARAAENGDADAAFALYDGLNRCRRAYASEKDLLRAVELLHQTHQLQTASDAQPSLLSDSSLDDLDGIEESFLRKPFEYCRGVTQAQKAEAEKWLGLGVASGHFWATAVGAELAAREGDARRVHEAMQTTWRSGNVAALAWLAQLHSGWGENPLPRDPVHAYAYSYMDEQLHRAAYGDTLTRIQRRELGRLAAETSRRARDLRPQELEAAIARAKAMLKENRNCCYIM